MSMPPAPGETFALALTAGFVGVAGWKFHTVRRQMRTWPMVIGDVTRPSYEKHENKVLDFIFSYEDPDSWDRVLSYTYDNEVYRHPTNEPSGSKKKIYLDPCNPRKFISRTDYILRLFAFIMSILVFGLVSWLAAARATAQVVATLSGSSSFHGRFVPGNALPDRAPRPVLCL